MLTRPLPRSPLAAFGHGGSAARPRFALSPDGEGGDGEGGGGGTGGRERTDRGTAGRIIDAEYGGDALRGFADMVTQRDRAKERARLAEAKVPADGTVAVPRADADELAAWRALGIAKPADAKAALDAGAAATAKLDGLEKAAKFAKLGTDHGKNGAAIARLADLGKFDVRVDTVDMPDPADPSKTKPVARLMAVRKGANGQETAESLDALVAREFPEFAVAVNTAAPPTGSPAPGTNGTPAAPGVSEAPSPALAAALGGVTWPSPAGSSTAAPAAPAGGTSGNGVPAKPAARALASLGPVVIPGAAKS